MGKDPKFADFTRAIIFEQYNVEHGKKVLHYRALYEIDVDTYEWICESLLSGNISDSTFIYAQKLDCVKIFFDHESGEAKCP